MDVRQLSFGCNLIIFQFLLSDAGTRGANRGEKNEIRSALRTQVRRAYDNLDDVIMDFVNNNRDSLFQIML